MPLEEILEVAALHPGMKGTLQATASGQVELQPATKSGYRIDELHADITAKGVQLQGQPLGDAKLTASSQGLALRAHLESTVAGSTVKGDGEWRLDGDYPGAATLSFSRVDLAQLKPWLATSPGGESASQFAGSMEGVLHVEGPALNWRAMKAELRIPQFELGPANKTDIAAQVFTLKNSGPIVARFANSIVTVESAHLVGKDTDLHLTGRVLPEQKNPLDLRVNGRVDLSLLRTFSSDLISSGGVIADATVRGSFSDPQINGRLNFEKAAFSIVDVPNGISEATGTVIFTKERATIQNLSGETGGGKIDLSGFASYGGGQAVFRLHARAREVRVRYPEGVSTVANANLNLTGTSDSSMLSGTVTVLRTGVNLQSDFSSILAKSAEPVRTPSARKGPLAGLSFDVQIETAPDVQLESSLTENLQAEANLRLRGTASNPALLGRINITQGKLTFFGTKYTLSQGSIAFYNPVKIEPILNIDLETKARGIDIADGFRTADQIDPDAAQRSAAAIQRNCGATGHGAGTDIRPFAIDAAEFGTAIVAADGGIGATGFGDRQPRGGALAAIFRSEQAAHRSDILRRGKQSAGAADAGATGDAGAHLHLHHQRDQQQSASRSSGVGLLPAVVGGSAARRKRAVRSGLFL